METVRSIIFGIHSIVHPISKTIDSYMFKFSKIALLVCAPVAIVIGIVLFFRYFPFNTCSECKSFRTRTRKESSALSVICDVCGYTNTLPLPEDDEDEELAF